MSPSTAESSASTSPARMPVTFLAHGAPILLDDADWMAELAAWADALPHPRAVLVLSAHWDARPVAIGATRTVPLIYDFYGFPERYYQTRYEAPGAPALATRVQELLRERRIAYVDAPERGLDHGAYVPLVAMYPQADVPVLQLSLPGLDPNALLELGRALAPLRDEGVLIVGSGFLTHNMQYAFRPGIPEWAREFDAWTSEVLTNHDLDALADFRARAPAAGLAHPTWEHFAPVLVSAAAAGSAQVRFPITGFWMNGAFTRRSVQFG